MIEGSGLPVSMMVFRLERIQDQPTTLAAVLGEFSSRSWIRVSLVSPSVAGSISQVTRLSGSAP
jgi:hypothetical protein